MKSKALAVVSRPSIYTVQDQHGLLDCEIFKSKNRFRVELGSFRLRSRYQSYSSRPGFRSVMGQQRTVTSRAKIVVIITTRPRSLPEHNAMGIARQHQQL